MIKNIMNELMNEFMNLLTNKISLPQEYHNFADKRIFLGIPNMMNVISNFVFLIPAIIYFKRTKKNTLLILHIILLSIASGYYHFNPSDETIFWDILMIATTSMIVLITISDTKYGLLLYSYAIFSILYWKYSDDLRLYILILIGVPLYIVLKYYKNINLKKYIYVIVFMGILTRISEHNDHFIYKLTNKQISGHTLKHIFAIIAVWYVVKLLQKVNKF